MMAVSKATYWYRCWFIHNHNIIVHKHYCDWLTSNWNFMPVGKNIQHTQMYDFCIFWLFLCQLVDNLECWEIDFSFWKIEHWVNYLRDLLFKFFFIFSWSLTQGLIFQKLNSNIKIGKKSKNKKYLRYAPKIIREIVPCTVDVEENEKYDKQAKKHKKEFDIKLLAGGGSGKNNNIKGRIGKNNLLICFHVFPSPFIPSS